MKKYTGFLSMLLAMSVMLTGCSVSVSDTSNVDTSSQLDSAAEDSNTSAAGEGIETVSMMNLSASVPCSFDPASLFTDRDLREDYEVTAEITLNGDSASVSGEGAVADGSTVTITAEGVYRISGTLNDGQLNAVFEKEILRDVNLADGVKSSHGSQRGSGSDNIGLQVAIVGRSLLKDVNTVGIDFEINVLNDADHRLFDQDGQCRKS